MWFNENVVKIFIMFMMNRLSKNKKENSQNLLHEIKSLTD